MDERGYKRWTQTANAEPGARGLQILLRLARENEAALRSDLKEAAAARNAASGALESPAAGGCGPSESRRQALRRLLGSLERSEASIRQRLAAVKAEADKLEALTGRNSALQGGGGERRRCVYRGA